MKNIITKHTFGNAETTSPIWGLGGLLFALCITSCSSDNELSSAYDSDPNAVHVNATIGSPSQTRLNSDGDGNAWDSGDQIYVTNTNGISGKKEAAFKYDGSSWAVSGTNYIVWADGENTFQAYYPYGAKDGAGNAVTASFSSFTLPKHQYSSAGGGGIGSADWMIATKSSKKTDDKSITLDFEHQLAKVTFNITPGAQYDEDEFSIMSASVYLPKTVTDTRVTITDDSKDGDYYYVSPDVIGTNVRAAVLPAGTYASGQNLLNVGVVNGKSTDDLYVQVPSSGTIYDLLCTDGLKAGKSYTFNVTVGKDVMTIGDVTVKDWTDGKDKTGGTADEVPTGADAATNTVHISNAGELTAALISEALGTDGTELKLTGNMNDKDFETLRTNASTLTKLDLSGVNLTELPKDALKALNNLTEVTLPANCTTLGEGAFCGGCKALTTINGLDNVTTVGNTTFNACEALQSIKLPAVTSIGNNSFSYCTALQNIELPAATTIDNWALCECTSLKELKLPSATTLGQVLFGKSTALTSIELTSKTFTSVSADIFKSFSPTKACTLTLNDSQSKSITVNTEDNTCKWTPVEGTTITLSDAFSTVICGTTTKWTKSSGN